jgi:hypothetical protein
VLRPRHFIIFRCPSLAASGHGHRGWEGKGNAAKEAAPEEEEEEEEEEEGGQGDVKGVEKPIAGTDAVGITKLSIVDSIAASIAE